LQLKVIGIAETVKALNAIDKDIVKEARKDLRTGAKPVALAIKANIPTDAPLSGMIHNGRTAWKPSGVKATVKTNFSKKGERLGFSLVSIVVGGKGQGAAMFQIADISGRKKRGKTASGRNMINVLNSRKGKASRFVYPAGLRAMPYVKDSVNGTIKKLSRTYNARNK
jgi:hypothetical protein